MSSFCGECFGEFERSVDLCIQVEEKAKPSRCDRRETPVSLFHGSSDSHKPAMKDKLTKTTQRNAFSPCSHQKVSWKCIIFTFKPKKTPHFNGSIWKVIYPSMLNSALKFTSHIPHAGLHTGWCGDRRGGVKSEHYLLKIAQKSDFSPDGTCNNPEVFQPSSSWLLFPLPSVTQLKSTSSALPPWSLSKGVLSLLWHKIKSYINNTTYQDYIKKKKNRHVLKAV